MKRCSIGRRYSEDRVEAIVLMANATVFVLVNRNADTNNGLADEEIYRYFAADFDVFHGI